MSTLAAKAYHPINGSTEDIWEGFSWPCLFFGFFWYLYKGMWGWGLIALILAGPTFFISWFVLPFLANEQYAKFLLNRGYLNEDQWNKRKKGSSERENSYQHPEKSSVADELAKLAALKEQGILNDEEFEKQKKKVLSY